VRGILGLKAKRAGDFALRIERPDGPPVTMYLDNIYAEASQVDGDARAERLRRAVLAIAQPRPATWRDAAPRLLPAVRTPSWPNAMIPTAGAGARTAVPFGKPLVPFVKVLCAIDSGTKTLPSVGHSQSCSGWPARSCSAAGPGRGCRGSDTCHRLSPRKPVRRGSLHRLSR
jgi:hypothetical protein